MIRLRRPHAAAALLLVLAGALSACLLTPGRFTSALDLRRDGRFTFSYAGEIHMLALSRLAQMGNKAKVFEPETCYNDEAKERPCTAEELADQKKTFEDQRKERGTKDQQEAEQMKALLGGIDPSSPQAAEEMAARLRRQTGWKSVVYKGDGLFVVDFAITGRLDHDFVFPTIERVPLANAFVQLSRRADGTVRIDAPGYSASSGGGNPMSMALAGMAGAAAGKAGGKGDSPGNPFGPLEGTFVLTTDGTVLANNTDEGPQPDPAGQRLSWTVNVRNGAPTALVRLAP